MIRDCVRDTVNDVIKDPIEFNPLDFGVLAWYDAADSGTITESGGLVSEWRDKSGNANNATQGTGANQPTYSDSSIIFDGTNDFLNFDMTGIVGTDYTVLVVDERANTNQLHIFRGSSTSANSNLHIRYNNSTEIILDQFGNSLLATIGSFTAEQKTITTAILDQSVGRYIYRNGGLVNSDNSTTTLVSNADQAIGAFNPDRRYDGKIYEFMFFNRALTSSERTQITNYLRTKWSIPFTPLELSPIAWYDASDASTITESGGLVSQWDDKSGNGNNATQGTGALQPSLADNTMTFGSNRALTFTAALNVRSIIIVYKDEETSDFTTPFTRGTDTPNSWWHGSEFATNSIFRSASTVTAIKDADHYRNNVLFNYNSSPGILDDRPLDFTVFNINSTVSFNTESDVWWIGGDRNLSGRSVTAIKELVLFDKILTSSERTQITNYLRTKWAIPFTPLELSPIAWYDASDASTITESGGLVSQWDDKSGNGYNATQATGALQPTTGTRTVGGLNVIDFDGSADFLSLPSGVYNGLGESDNSLFVVYKTDAIATDQRIVTGITTSSATRWGILYNQASDILSGVSATTFLPVELSITNDTNTHIDGMIRNGSNLTTFRDNSDLTEASASNVTLLSANISSRDGISNFLDGVICEILIFKRAVTSAERTQITNYLATKWSITL